MIQQRHESGATLLEVVIALAILAVMGVIALEAVRVGAGAWDKTERRAEADQRLRVTHDVLAHEFAQLEAVTMKIEGRNVTGFRGDSEQVVFYAAPDVTAEAPYAGMFRRVSLLVVQDKGLTIREGWPLVDGLAGFEPGAAMRVLDPRVTAMRLRYLAPPTRAVAEPHWIENWDPVDRLLNSVRMPGSRTANTGLLPSAVELTLTVLEDGGARTRQFLFPIPVGRYLL